MDPNDSAPDGDADSTGGDHANDKETMTKPTSTPANSQRSPTDSAGTREQEASAANADDATTDPTNPGEIREPDSPASHRTGDSKPKVLVPRSAEISQLAPPAQQELIDRRSMQWSRQAARKRYPHQMLKLSTVAMSSRARSATKAHISYVMEHRKPHKVVTWDEAMNARPPLRIDCDGPSMCSYSPNNKPLNETNSPVWSFGRRTYVEKQGGTRTSWAKTWFQDPDVWCQKTDFFTDQHWPSPVHYPLKPVLGPQHVSAHVAPAHSIGIRRSMKINKYGSEHEPGPNTYDQLKGKAVLSRTFPSFSHGLRRNGTILWSSTPDATPGPGAYSPREVFRHHPEFTIRGTRREKSHIWGPFAMF